MKLLLQFPNFRRFSPFNLVPFQPPLSLGYLASILHKNNISYEVLDACAENLSLHEIEKRIHAINPTMIGITTNISIAYAAVQEALMIKRKFPNIIIIMGGPWVAANYEFVLQKKIADIVCFNEGEYTLLEIAQNYNAQKSLEQNIEMLEKTKGIAIFINQKINKTPERPFIKNLDELPFPLWDKFPLNKYSTIHRTRPFLPLITTRGCPYSCINCTKIIHGTAVRSRSTENIIAELEFLIKRYGAKEILITDDIFNYDLKKCKALLRKIIEKKFNLKFQLNNGIRADNIDAEFAILLSAAGFYKVAIGIESASKGIIKFINKRLDLDIVPKAIDMLKNANIIVHGYFIMGFPHETKNSLIYSIDYADKLNLDFVNMFTLVLFPGSKLYEYLITQKYSIKLPKHPFLINLHTEGVCFDAKSYTKLDFEKARLYYIIRFFLNPRRLLRFIKSLNINELFVVLKMGIAFIFERIKKILS